MEMMDGESLGMVAPLLFGLENCLNYVKRFMVICLNSSIYLAYTPFVRYTDRTSPVFQLKDN